MYLINWLQANLLMVFVTICLIAIPAVMIYVAFKKYEGPDANVEAYKDMQSGEGEKQA